MKKLYTKAGAVCITLLLSASAFSQQRISDQQIKPVLEKLQTLGKANPAAALPIEKLTKEEIKLFYAYQKQTQELKTNPFGITQQELDRKIPKSSVQHILDRMESLTSALAFPEDKFTPAELRLLRIYELQNMPKLTNTSKAISTAFVKNARTTHEFGTIPMTPPHTMSVLSTIPNTIYCDDVAGDGNLYAIDNDQKNLVKITPAGTLETIGNLGAAVPAAATTVGLSWNSANNTMYLIAASSLYTVDMNTGAATLVAALSGLATGAIPIWLEIDNSGNAFMADVGGDNLYRIDLTSGAAALVGPLGININFAQEADFDKETNQLYMAAYVGGGVGGIYQVNTTTGASTMVGDTTPNNAEYTVFSISETIEPPALDKAFVLDLIAAPNNFGTMPLVAPHTITSISAFPKNVYADDMAGDGNLYALDQDAKTLIKVYSDGSNAVVGPLTNIQSGHTLTGLSWNRANNTMYATSTNGTVGTLYTVNLDTGIATMVANTTNSSLPIWLEIDNNGIAYIADVQTDILYSLDLSSGVATEIGALGIDLNYAQDADFNTSTNTLYMAAYLNGTPGSSGLYEVNTTTGAATLIGDTTPNELAMFTIANTLPDAPPIPPVNCGTIFTDSGGTAGNYSNSEDITTVIEPVNAGDAVTITFTQVEIETSTSTGTVAGCWDYLSIYNGPDISSPELAAVKCGRTGSTPSVASSLLSVGDTFTSTDPSGKLTVRFRSDSSLNFAGWQATVSCATMAVDEANAHSFSYYPNPTSGILNISSKNKIESLEIYNMAGQKVMTLNPKENASEINMSKLQPGVYMVKAVVNGKVITNKVIKK